jgi:hypothetical protein
VTPDVPTVARYTRFDGTAGSTLSMTTRQDHRRAFLRLLLAASALPVRGVAQQPAAGVASRPGGDPKPAGHHVYPKDQIQDALDAAARDAVNKTVYVHAGTYRPAARGQALIWLNGRHDGITLEAVGDVTLTAGNPEIADPAASSYPAVVNHVVYFGDGVSRKTVFRGFKITGANNFTTGSGEKSPIESDDVRKTPFFYVDGGGIKVYARAYPTIERVEIHGNYTSPCGGGVSVEHLGQTQDSVLFRDCIFRNNRTQITGSALDLLHGSRATIENCLFVGNIANMGVDYVGLLTGGEYHPDHGSGAMTVFEGSRATVTNSTFTGNWNGVDDGGAGSTYVSTIFWKNTLRGGISAGSRYELDILDGAGVQRSFIHGEVNDLRGTLSREANVLDAPDPDFDAHFSPRSSQYSGVGYRPVKPSTAERRSRP